MVIWTTAALMILAAPSTASVQPAISATPTPTQHSYDDGHSGGPEGSGLAFWILLGAVSGLVVISGVLLKNGRGASRH